MYSANDGERDVKKTVDAVFRDAVRRFPDRIFVRRVVRQLETTLTYGESASVVADMIGALAAAGYSFGDRAVVCVDDPVDYIHVTLACAHLGVVLVPVSTASSASFVSRLIEDTRAKHLIASDRHAPALRELGLSPFAAGTRSSGTPVREAMRRLEILGEAVHEESDYVIIHTSGSTGRPKLVLRDHRSFILGSVPRTFDLRAEAAPPERVLFHVDLVHVLGHTLLITGLLLGAELCVPTGLGTDADIREIRKFDPTYIRVVPRHLAAWKRQVLELGESESRLFGPSARVLTFGGAAGDASLLRQLTEQGIDVVEGYGSSETLNLILGERGKWREGYVGKASPGVELKVSSEGELLARGPLVFRGYLGDEKATREAFTEDGWYRTGDQGEIDRDGEVRILGRIRDVFNTFDGANIYPAHIESGFEKLPWIKQILLLGDQRPYIIALIAVGQKQRESALTEADGYLPEAGNPGLYDMARTEIRRINEQFEPNERIREFALFGRDFPIAVHEQLASGKVRRNRPQAQTIYKSRVQNLYETRRGGKGERQMTMKTIGLLGGLSWHSTADYYKFINEEFQRRLGGHNSARIIMASVNLQDMRDTDRDGKVALLTKAVKSIEAGGADFLVICANTPHAHANLLKQIKIPLLHIADAVGQEVKGAKLTKVGLMATKLTIDSAIYDDVLKKHNVELIRSSAEDVQRMDDIIRTELMVGNVNQSSKNDLIEIGRKMKSAGAQGIIFGCTEFPHIIGEKDMKLPCFDSTVIHAMATVNEAIGLSTALPRSA